MRYLPTAAALCLWAATACAAEKLQVYFSPHGGCTEAVVEQLNKVRSNVYIQAYSFTSAPIAEALLEAHRRGVKVFVILDKSQRTEKYSEADFLVHGGIPTFIDSKHAVAHNKIIIADGRTVLTGSFNFTTAAEEHNAENLLVIDDPALAKKYLENWKSHQAHSDAYTGHAKQGKGFWRSLVNSILN
jgi:phosphatidylserine/phosphatidylglycerophosphate/cardiolipin synthase-like enzyme